MIYKHEAFLFREDKQKNLHQIHDEKISKESIAILLNDSKVIEIGVNLPKDVQLGDYLLKIRLYNEDETCFYNIYQWFEAYISQQVSYREKPIPVGPANYSGNQVTPNEEDVLR